jgi:gamma-glutamyltranspeptidase / glutathione hydrolase
VRTRFLAALAFVACTGQQASTDPVARTTAAPKPSTLSSASAVASVAPAPSASVATAKAPPVNPAGKRTVASQRGLVVGVERQAVKAGVRILEAGGNAIDAAVAIAFALAVTHPSAGNIGGGGFLLVRPKSGPTAALDFRETAPAALTRARFDQMIAAGGEGAASVGVPGTVRGLWVAHEKLGKLEWKMLVQPAIELAKQGHVISSREAKTFVWNEKGLAKDKAAVAEFFDQKKPRPEGQRLVRGSLGRTLERIAKDGDKGFYEGETARLIAKRLGQGGLVTEQDLLRYEAKWREPIVFSYRGYTLETMPPPSAGGVVVLEILGMLAELEAWKETPGSANELHLFLEASRRAQADRRFSIVDPDSLDAMEWAKRLTRFRDTRGLLGRLPIDREHATPSDKVHPLYIDALREAEHTTHFSVVDADGMVVSCTTTLSAGFGSKLVVPGTGVVLNNAVASFGTAGENQPSAGRRTISSMAPTLAYDGDGTTLVLGSPGGDTIPSTIVQVFRHLVDHGMSLDGAVDAPRIHHGFVPDEFRYENARPIPKPVRDALVELGHVVSKKTLPMGDANDIVVKAGIAYGYADPREGGVALAPSRK